MLEETGTKVSISTVKRVLYRQPERLLSFRLTNFLVMTRDVGFDTKAYFSKNTCLRYI